MNLMVFTQEAYKLLKSEISVNEDNYYSQEPWLDKYFETHNITEYYKMSSLNVGKVNLQYTGNSDAELNADDLQNVINLYSTYKGIITPSQASDCHLWTALCHMVPEYKDYIIKRWANKATGKVTISARFFATSGRTSLIYYNAISRLWWSGYLTYEEEKSRTNPWELTKILLSAQQIQKDLTDQSYSMNPTIVKGLLRALKRIQEETNNAATTPFRNLTNSYINHYGAVTVLDFLTSEEIEEIAYKYMKTQL